MLSVIDEKNNESYKIKEYKGYYLLLIGHSSGKTRTVHNERVKEDKCF